MSRYALVIGVSEYQSSSLSQLPKAAIDAEEVAKILETYGDFEQVIRLPNKYNQEAKRNEVAKKQVTKIEVIEKLKELLWKKAAKSEVLIYFAGHGLRVVDELEDLQGFLAVSDCEIQLKEDKVVRQENGIALELFNRLIKNEKCDISSLVVMLDCCHSGSLLTDREIRKTLTVFGLENNFYLIAGCRSFENARAFKDEKNSIFTGALLKGLSPENANSKGEITCNRVFDYIIDYTKSKDSGQEPISIGGGRSITLVRYFPHQVEQFLRKTEDQEDSPTKNLKSENKDNFLKSILMISTNPKGTNGLRLQEEEREIKERLRFAGYGKVPISTTVATRPKDIQQEMLYSKPQIVHFSGHGTGEKGLVFEDENGQVKLVGSDALANLFKIFSKWQKERRLECVILNACYSEFQAKAISQHIDYVIGMSQSIGDRAAIAFSVGFYSAVGAGESIEFAYELGRNAIELEGISEHLTPVLYKEGKSLPLNINDRSLPNRQNQNTVRNISKDDPANLMEILFDALCNPNLEEAIKTFEGIAHKSLFINGEIDPNFLKNNFKPARKNANQYQRPIKINDIKTTRKTRIGSLYDREYGKEKDYVIARNYHLNEIDGHIYIFFPGNSKEARISHLIL